MHVFQRRKFPDNIVRKCRHTDFREIFSLLCRICRIDQRRCGYIRPLKYFLHRHHLLLSLLQVQFSTVHTYPLPTCALVALTRFSSALRAKTAYVGGGCEFHSPSGIGECFLHASMTLHSPISEYGVNCNLFSSHNLSTVLLFSPPAVPSRPYILSFRKMVSP